MPPKLEKLQKVADLLVKEMEKTRENEQYVKNEDVVRLFNDLKAAISQIETNVSRKATDQLQGLLTEAQVSLTAIIESRRAEAYSALNEAIDGLNDVQRSLRQVTEATQKLSRKEDKEAKKIAEQCRKMLKSMQDDMNEYATIDDVTGFVDRALENHPKESIESIRDGLETLQGDERLDKSAIKGLEEELQEIREIKSSSKTTSTGGITGRDVIQKYDLSPYLDGVTKVFNIPGNWTILDVSGTSFPYQFRRLIDYTFTSQEITFTDQVDAAGSLAAGQTVEILFVIG